MIKQIDNFNLFLITDYKMVFSLDFGFDYLGLPFFF